MDDVALFILLGPGLVAEGEVDSVVSVYRDIYLQGMKVKLEYEDGVYARLLESSIDCSGGFAFAKYHWKNGLLADGRLALIKGFAGSNLRHLRAVVVAFVYRLLFRTHPQKLP